MTKGYLHVGAKTLLVLALFLAGTLNIESVPPLWWDEGWTLTVARTWVERGHYGCLLNGEPSSVGLAAAFPVTAPIALSFRLLGIGVWQARVVGVVWTLGTLGLIYYLACRLYGRPVAIGTLVVLLFMLPQSQLHPIPMGRQVLGEMPMLFYLLAGYACFLLALQRPLWLMLAVISWGITLIAKAQVLPFWTVSLLLPFLIMLYRQRWRLAVLLSLGLLGSLTVSRGLYWLQQLVMRNYEGFLGGGGRLRGRRA